MPILAVNQFGQIYETSPDREDGGGYGGSPECVSQGDLTLGAAYIKSQAARQQELLKQRRDNKYLDAKDATTRMIAFAAAKNAKAKNAAEARLLADPKVQKAATQKALNMGCSCEYSTPMSGNVMTANGQKGWAGMSRDQQVIHYAVTGQGSNVAHRADPAEVAQANQRAQAERILRLKARR